MHMDSDITKDMQSMDEKLAILREKRKAIVLKYKKMLTDKKIEEIKNSIAGK